MLGGQLTAHLVFMICEATQAGLVQKSKINE